MPQITIEYSANLDSAFDPRTLARRVHDIVAATIDTELASCKTRILRHEQTLVGDGAASNAMLHIDLRILSGRAVAEKTALGEQVLAAAQGAVEKPAGLDVQITVEVRDLDRENYHKKRL